MKTTRIIWDHNSDIPGWYARYNDPGNESINHQDNYLDCEDPEESTAKLLARATREAPQGMTDETGSLLGEVTFHP